MTVNNRNQNGGKKFLFINKSSESRHLTRSTPVEQADIQRHIQTGRPRTRIAAVRKNNGFVPVSSQQSASKGSSSGKDEYFYRGSSASGARRSKAKSECSPKIGSRSLTKSDPFNASSVQIDGRVAALLHYYTIYQHPSQWPNEMILLRQGVYMFEDAVASLISTAISDELTMYCLLSSAACRLQYIDRLPSACIHGAETTYIMKALRLMASQIKDIVQRPDHVNRILTCIMFLGSAEAYRGDLAAARAHLDASAKLLEPLDGIPSVQDKVLRGRFAMADLYLSCIEIKPCSFDCWYDPGPAHLLDLKEHELRLKHVFSEAQSLLKSGSHLPPGLSEIIEELVESHNVKSRVLPSSMPSQRARHVLHWITMRNMAIRHKLLSLELLDPKNHALRIAIIMWSLFAMNITGRAKTVKLMACSLRMILVRIAPHDWNTNQSLKLWIHLVGAHCSDKSSEEYLWFQHQCCGLISCLGWLPIGLSNSRLSDLLIRFQQDFFYDSETQRFRTQMLAEEFQHCISYRG